MDISSPLHKTKNFKLFLPLPGMAKKKVIEGHLLQIFRDNEKAIERMGWKNYDREEFVSAFLKMMNSLAAIGNRFNTEKHKHAINVAKLNITGAEAQLFCRKITDTFTYIKKKIRDSGSGTRLPIACIQVSKVWCKKPKAEGKAGGKRGAKPQNIRDTLGLGPKEPPIILDIPSDSEGGV